MTVPIISYGHIVLRQVCRNADPDDSRLETIMENLTDTMDAANGVGLAGSQINEPIKIFMIDTRQIYYQMKAADRPVYFPDNKGTREIFINARMLRKSADTFIDQEGCLSIPSLHEEIARSWSIEIEYQDRFFQKKTRKFSGLTARAIQHEIYESDSYNLSLTRTELGAMIGTTRETITRILHEYTENNLISIQGKNVKILNKEMLQRISDAG